MVAFSVKLCLNGEARRALPAVAEGDEATPLKGSIERLAAQWWCVLEKGWNRDAQAEWRTDPCRSKHFGRFPFPAPTSRAGEAAVWFWRDHPKR